MCGFGSNFIILFLGGNTVLSEKAIEGLINASPEKRYKSFLNTVTDLEMIWIMPLVDEDDDSKTKNIYAVLWPCKELSKYCSTECRRL